MRMKRNCKLLIISCLAIFAVLFSSTAPVYSQAPTQVDDPSAPSSPVKLIFIHHSSGEAWLADSYGALGFELMYNNYFVSDTNYGWGPDSIGTITDFGHWYTWFRGSNSATYLEALFSESGQHATERTYSRLAQDPGGENEIIMFKSCFPNSGLKGSPDDPIPAIENNPLRGQDFASSAHTIANAKGIYLDLLNTFAEHPEKLFIIITAPPLRDATYADNARAFNNWMVDRTDGLLKDYTLNNVAVFDYYNVLTSNGGDVNTNDLGAEAGNHHRWWNGEIQHQVELPSNVSAYPVGDDHPTAAGDAKASKEFVTLLNIYYHRWKNDGSPSVPTTNPYTATATSLPANTATPAPENSWVFCANENSYCSFTGTREVRYGANTSFAYITATNGIVCSNAFFGDPAPYQVKTCSFWNGESSTATATPVTPTSTQPATNTATAVPATATNPPTATQTIVPPTATNTPVPSVTNSPFPTATRTAAPSATSAPTLTNTPAPSATWTTVPTQTHTPAPSATWTSAPTSTSTSAPLQSGTWVRCADENGFCSFTGTYQVRYGANNIYSYVTATNGTACTNAVFGDPIPMVVKKCDYWLPSDGSTATPSPQTSTPTATAAPVSSGIWVACASENGYCAFNGTYQVRYGARDAYAYLTLTNGTACTNTVFGDPIMYVAKSCSYWLPAGSSTATPAPATNTPVPTRTTIPGTATNTPAPTRTPTTAPSGTWVFCANENGYCSFTGTYQVRYGARDAYAYLTLTNGTACTNTVFGDPIRYVVKSCSYFVPASRISR